MTDNHFTDIPKIYGQLQTKSKEIGFTMPSDLYIGSFLKTLVASKPAGRFLELGTGMSLSLSWMVAGMGAEANLVSVDNDPQLIEIAESFFADDDRVQLVCEDGAVWMQNYEGPAFDLIFADAWPGKYHNLDEVLALLKTGGFYIIDDMTPQANWPEGHAQKAERLIATLEQRSDLQLTKMTWSTGVIMAVKI
ncbi:MAG: class I SAM-dependent methyltransferase [Bacteroidota bacterium]